MMAIPRTTISRLSQVTKTRSTNNRGKRQPVHGSIPVRETLDRVTRTGKSRLRVTVNAAIVISVGPRNVKTPHRARTKKISPPQTGLLANLSEFRPKRIRASPNNNEITVPTRRNNIELVICSSLNHAARDKCCRFRRKGG